MDQGDFNWGDDSSNENEMKTLRVWGRCLCTDCAHFTQGGGCYCLSGELDQSGQRCKHCICLLAKHQSEIFIGFNNNLQQVKFHQIPPPESDMRLGPSVGASTSPLLGTSISSATTPRSTLGTTSAGGNSARGSRPTSTIESETSRVLGPYWAGSGGSNLSKRLKQSLPQLSSQTPDFSTSNDRKFTIQVMECNEISNPTATIRGQRIVAGLVGFNVGMPGGSGEIGNIMAIRAAIPAIGDIPFKFVVTGNGNKVVQGNYGSSRPPGYQHLVGMYPGDKDVLIRLEAPLSNEVIDATSDDDELVDDNEQEG